MKHIKNLVVGRIEQLTSHTDQSLIKDNEEAWKLIRELEKDNDALTNSVRNSYRTMQEQIAAIEERLKKILKQNKKLIEDNKILRKMVVSQTSAKY